MKSACASLRQGSGQALLMACLAMCGCSADKPPDWAGVKGDMEPAKLSNFTETARFEVRWSSDAGDLGENMLQPALTKDAVYGV
ncbi:MAG: hypothetical protein OEV15_09120, partial [Gallionella sp.]|nr:hypothetical protein [Gallionella sp.]